MRLIRFFCVFAVLSSPQVFGQRLNTEFQASTIKRELSKYYQLVEGNIQINNHPVTTRQWTNIAADTFIVEILNKYDSAFITVFFLTDNDQLVPNSHIKIRKQVSCMRYTPNESFFGVLFEFFKNGEKATCYRLLENTIPLKPVTVKKNSD
jgi:hypothetical protein